MLNNAQVWQAVLDDVAREIPDSGYEWLRHSRLIPTQKSGNYLLHVKDASVKFQVDTRYRIEIEHSLQRVLGFKEQPLVTVVVNTRLPGRTAMPQRGDPLFADEEDTAEETPAPPDAMANSVSPRNGRPTNEERRRKRQMRVKPASPPRGYEAILPPRMPAAPHATPPRPDKPVDGADMPAWLNERYTFDTFIVGNSNKFAYAACRAVGDEPGNSYNPLFLYGGVGLGKTHLLHAIAHTVAPYGYRILYVTSETFTNEIVNAIRYRTTEEFRAKYRSVDLLLVDDIQFIAGKDSTEEEFFHTFNALHESRKQVVICSDRPPKAIDLDERLRSRFEWGLIADIQPPDLETRLAILRAKAEAMNVTVEDSVLEYLAEHIQSNVRELEGNLNRIVTFAKIYNVPLTIDIIKQALSSLVGDEKPKRRVAPIEILLAVSHYYKISMDDLKGKQRDKHIVMPRQVAMYLIRQETEVSLVEVGEELGGRDHSTVLHGVNKIEHELLRKGSPLIQDVQAIRQMVDDK